MQVYRRLGLSTTSRRPIRTTHGPLVTLPYSVELNDIPMMIVQHHESDYLFKRAMDQFDRLYAEGEERAKIMALAIHPYISGQPHRIKYLEDDLQLRQRLSTACCTGTAWRSSTGTGPRRASACLSVKVISPVVHASRRARSRAPQREAVRCCSKVRPHPEEARAAGRLEGWPPRSLASSTDLSLCLK